jgi:hypothetical protein
MTSLWSACDSDDDDDDNDDDDDDDDEDDAFGVPDHFVLRRIKQSIECISPIMLFTPLTCNEIIFYHAFGGPENLVLNTNNEIFAFTKKNTTIELVD